MMVSAAAHTGDIVGAKTVGLRVASTPRGVCVDQSARSIDEKNACANPIQAFTPDVFCCSVSVVGIANLETMLDYLRAGRYALDRDIPFSSS